MSMSVLGLLGAGVLTYLTPCVLPLIPIYLAALAGGSPANLAQQPRRRLVGRAMLFALGFLAVFVSLGLAASTLGAWMMHWRPQIQAFGAVFIMLFGLKFLGLIEVPALDRVLRAQERGGQSGDSGGSVSAVLMGVFFAAGWSPCVGPVLGSVLTYTASSTADPLTGAWYLGLYGLGFAIPLVATALFITPALSLLKRMRRWLPVFERATGGLLVVVAVSLLLGALDASPVLLANAAASSGVTASTNSVTDGTDGVAAERIPMMLELYTADCPICRAMAPIVDEVAAECDSGSVRVKQVDVSLPENRALTSTYRLVGVPTFLFLDESGAEVARLIGKQTEQGLKQAMSALRGESCEGVGPVPGADQPLKVSPNEVGEGTSCQSMNMSADLATSNLKRPGPSQSASKTLPAKNAENQPVACSVGSL